MASKEDIVFLALLTWREARGESDECKTGVACSVMNRVTSAQWHDNAMDVAFQHLQYSSLTHKKDPQITTWPKSTDTTWKRCMEIAELAADGRAENPIDGADSYHDVSMKDPNWATKQNFIKRIGRIKFYRVGKS